MLNGNVICSLDTVRPVIRILTYHGRTHRERKEEYIKALEGQVLLLTEECAMVRQERDDAVKENQRLKQLLPAPTSIDLEPNPGLLTPSILNYDDRCLTADAFITPSMTTSPSVGPIQPVVSVEARVERMALETPSREILDYDQISIDFILRQVLHLIVLSTLGRAGAGVADAVAPQPRANLPQPCAIHERAGDGRTRAQWARADAQQPATQPFGRASARNLSA